jgi:hypothetical protein
VKVIAVLAIILFTPVLVFAQQKTVCQTYFQVVQNDRRIAGGVATGMNESQKIRRDKKSQKTYPGFCCNGLALSGDAPGFLLVSCNETQSTLVNDSDHSYKPRGRH